MFSFDVWAKYGNRWSYRGTVKARDSRLAAIQISRSSGRRKIKVRPEYCEELPCYYYNFKKIKFGVVLGKTCTV